MTQTIPENLQYATDELARRLTGYGLPPETAQTLAHRISVSSSLRQDRLIEALMAVGDVREAMQRASRPSLFRRWFKR